MAVACSVGLLAGPASAYENPIGAHSMLQLDAPPSFMQAMFSEAAAMHAGSIRLDVAPAFIFGTEGQPPDYSGLDQVIALARQYQLRVVGDLFTVPWWMANCQSPTDLSLMDRCGTDDLADYGAMIAQIVAHSFPVIRDWEIWNEPDTSSFFSGTPTQYAEMLRTAYDAIKQVDPGANVLLGSMSGLSGQSWLAQVFAVPGADAEHAFDTANIHERNRLDSLAGDVTAWKQFFAAHGFTGPLWVTEHGYPSDPAYQYDPAYSGGLYSQSAFLSASVPSLLQAGASMVFVTERDNLGGQFASEGVLGGDVLDPPVADPQVVEKPAFAAVRTLADCYVELGRDCPGPGPAAAPPTFAPARLGSAVTASVSVSDPGPGPLQLGRAVIPPIGPFAVQSDGCAGRLLEPDQTCPVTVRFSPLAGGRARTSLVLPSDNGATTVPLTGVSPSVSALEVRRLPTRRANRVDQLHMLALVVANPLSAPVAVWAARLAGGQFRLLARPCAGTRLSPGASCRLLIRFSAAQRRTARAALTLSGEGRPLLVGLRATVVNARGTSRVQVSVVH